MGTSVGPLNLEVYTQSGEFVTSEPLREAGTEEALRFIDVPPQTSAWKEINFGIEVPNDLGLLQPEFKVRSRYPDGRFEKQIIPTLGFEGSTWDSNSAEFDPSGGVP